MTRNIAELHDFLKERIIGQSRAIKRISQAFERCINLYDPNIELPRGVFLFLGPSGVGKTETARLLSEFLFGDRNHLKIFNMSEFKNADAINKFLGSPDNPKGQFGAYLETHKEGIILFDEMEKADPEFHDLFLQIFGEGAQITTYDGKQHSVKNFYFILTSNIGSHKLVNIDSRTTYDLIEESVIQSLRAKFRAEYINRIRYKIVFDALRRDAQERIAEIILKDFIRKRFEDKYNVNVIYYQNLLDHIVIYGIDERFGARHLRDYIEEHIGNALNEAIKNNTISDGILTVENRRIVFHTHPDNIIISIFKYLERKHKNLKIEHSVSNFFKHLYSENISALAKNITDYIEEHFSGKEGKLEYCFDTREIKLQKIEQNNDYKRVLPWFHQ